MGDFCYCVGVLLVQQWIYLSKIAGILLGSVSTVGMTSDFGSGGIRFESWFGRQSRFLPDFQIWVKYVSFYYLFLGDINLPV